MPFDRASTPVRSTIWMFARFLEMRPLRSNAWRAVVTSNRRTPNIKCRNSCVRGNWSPSMRSWAIKSQRANRSSILLRPVGQGGLTWSVKDTVGVAQHGAVQGVAARVGLTQFVGSYPLPFTGSLDVGRMRGSLLLCYENTGESGSEGRCVS
jgi:hypothetical protein